MKNRFLTRLVCRNVMIFHTFDYFTMLYWTTLWICTEIGWKQLFVEYSAVRICPCLFPQAHLIYNGLNQQLHHWLHVNAFFSLNDPFNTPCWDLNLKVDLPHGSLDTGDSIIFGQLGLMWVKELVLKELSSLRLREYFAYTGVYLKKGGGFFFLIYLTEILFSWHQDGSSFAFI